MRVHTEIEKHTFTPLGLELSTATIIWYIIHWHGDKRIVTESAQDNPRIPHPAWHVAPGCRVWIGGHNIDARRVVERCLSGTLRPPDGPLDVAFVVPKTAEEGVHFLGKLRRRLLRTGIIWVVFSRPESSRGRGSAPTRKALMDGITELGFIATTPGEVDIDDNYTSLGFRLAVT